MIITYHGGASVKLAFGDRSLLFNPPSKESPWKPLRIGVDVAFVSSRHPHFEGTSSLTGEPFIINGPGEYEVGGTFIRGFSSKTEYGGTPHNNTLYLFSFEDMSVAYLGALSHTDLDTGFLEAADEIDILFVPISGNGTLGASEAYELSVKLEPKVIVPIMFDGPKDTSLAQFVKEAGIPLSLEDKLTIKRKDLMELENSVMVIAPQG